MRVLPSGRSSSPPRATLGSTRAAGLRGDATPLLVAESIVSDRDIDLDGRVRVRGVYAGCPAGDPAGARSVVLGRQLEPQGIGFAAADRAGVRARRGERGRGCSWRRSRRSASCSAAASRGGWCRSRGRAARRCSSGSRRPRSRTRPASSPRPRRGRRSPAPRCARCGCASGRRSAARSSARRCSPLLPWLGPKFLLPAAPIAIALVRWTRAPRPPHRRARGGRGDGRLARRLRDDQRPPVRRPDAVRRVGVRATRPTGADSVAEHLERVPRLAALWIDRDVGLLRWAPVLALSVVRGRGCCGARAAPHVARAGRASARRRGRRGALRCSAAARPCCSSRRSPRPTIAGEWFAGAASSSPALPDGRRAVRRGACATRRAPAPCSARSRSLVLGAGSVLALSRSGTPAGGRDRAWTAP